MQGPTGIDITCYLQPRYPGTTTPLHLPSYVVRQQSRVKNPTQIKIQILELINNFRILEFESNQETTTY